jgi:4-amino-4-deoxy-L-arabinose transferase-like glycosyltransferase
MLPNSAELDFRSHHLRELFCFLAIYTAAMLAFATLALGSGSLHADMTEAWAWGKEFQLGYNKHPPISGWITGIWFALMPRTNLSFYLLSIVNAGVGLAGVWMLAGLFLGVRGRWAAVIFLILTPSYTAWALRFNANSVLLSSWPWAAYFFLQSLQRRSVVFGVLAGVAGAIALLSKYYSVILIATLFVVALLHPDRGRYFRSAVPYVTAAVGLLLIAPHVWWLVEANFPSLHYAISKTEAPAAETRQHAQLTLVVGYLCLGIGAAAFAVAFGRQSWDLLKRALAATFEPRTAWLIWLAHGPLVLTIAAYLVGNTRIAPMHLMPAFFALPVAFLVSSGAKVTTLVVRRLALCAAAVWLPLIFGSPLLASYALERASPLTTEPRREIADTATKIWHDLFDRPLRYVAGSEGLATATTFYSPDAPSYLMIASPSLSPWVGAEQVKEYGVFIICRAVDKDCIARGQQIIGDRPLRVTRAFSTSSFGKALPPQRFTLFILPPADMDFPD